MASPLYAPGKSYSQQQKRNQLRHVILETLEKRELLAADSAGVVFAQGTSQSYVDAVIGSYLQGTGADASGESGGINLQGSRWTNPTGGLSANQGDPSTVSWSIVPDGTVDSANNSTTNLVAFMDNIYGGGAGAIEDRPWFGIFERAYDRWSELSGLTFVYEANDDGVPMGGTNRGVSGVRGDVRIGGRPIDGNFGVLAFNYFPNNGGNGGFDGDMIIDTNDVFYFNSADGPTGENRGMSNVVMHEAGHGIGLGHVIPVDQTKLMEPTVSTAYLGPQHDDILASQQLYGDTNENDDTKADATDIGELANGLRAFNNVSVNVASDDDWYQFSVPSAGRMTLMLEPIGEQYQVGPQNGATGPVDTLRNLDLSFELQANDGSVLALVNGVGAGEVELLSDFDLTAGGSYFLRVIGEGAATADPQLYNLSIRMRGLTGTGVGIDPPRLLSVAPNVGEIFSFNQTNSLISSPNELVFRFNGSQFLDTDALTGIRITRSGHDGDFTDGDEVVIEPGFVGFGDSERIVIARFAEALPDDSYQVEVFGVDIPGEGITAVRNVGGDALLPRIAGTDRDTVLFDLELGNEIVAVVPQPTSRGASNTIAQARDQIEVYFNEGDLLHGQDVATGDVAPNPTVVDPSYYRLYADRGTVTNTDDAFYQPSSIQYYAARNMAVLTFASNIDELDPTQDTSFRLRIGTNEAAPSAPVVVAQPADPGSTFNVTGAADLGVLTTISSLQVSEQIVNSSAFPLDFPGAPDTPGSREIADDPGLGESHHLDDNPDSDTNLTVQFYNFNKVDPVSTDATGQPIFNSISPAQEQRAREVFELYGSILGMSFVETENQGWTIATAPIDGVSGTIGVANGVSAIMDAAENWNDEFGANDDSAKLSWFAVAMHEIGHLLGLGHSTELPPGTIMGGLYGNDTLGGEPSLLGGADVEPIFPGATDRVNAQYLHRPDSRDIDMYRFEVAAGSGGEFTAQIVAERLQDSSLLDSVLSLYRELPDGSREVIAVNDDYFSEDSYLKLNLQPGVYYIGVSASGNTDFNPEIEDSGLGGVTEGAYQLRTTFRPLEASSIVDVEGTELDGDADGVAGGVFNYWFNAAAPSGEEAGQRRTLFVDKEIGNAAGDGSRTSPYETISAAFAAAQPGDVVRIVANGGLDGDVATQQDNNAFAIGTGGLGNQPLSDGSTMDVPKGVTVMVDAGVLFKMGRSVIGVGSSTSSGDRSEAALQVLGTPEQQVFFTSFTDENLGIDTDPLSTTPGAGDWGGIIFRNALDRAEGRFDAELKGRFLNYVGYANMQYGGGQVPVDGQNRVITPLHMDTARPTLINNTITNSAFAAISANPNSFEETTFTTPRYQADTLFTPDYSRVGPIIHGNTVTDNSINGLFVRVETAAGQGTAAQTVSARWDDRDIVHVVADTLTIQGTPGGPLLETTPPALAVVNITDGGDVAGGQLVAGTSYSYRMTFVDANGNEGIASAATLPFTVVAGSNSIRLSSLPGASGDFVSRKVYRSDDGGTTFQLVAELDRSSTVHVDSAPLGGAILNTTTQLNRARLDANLVVDPGMVVKVQGGRIVTGVSAQLVAEGRDGLPVIFTSRQDDRYGAGGTFDTNADSNTSAPQPGDWGGLYFGHAGSGSLDNALVTYAGGVTAVGGTFAGFNAIEIHQSDVRIANSTIENNASGLGGSATMNRGGAGFNEGAAIFVRGTQPVIVDNIIRNNDEAAISIDPQSMSGNSVKDKGRITGEADQRASITENKGPLLRGNALGGNDVNALVLRGATLITESIWDDTDIVHAVFDEILVPDLYVFGGLQLQSSPNESLVVKFGPGAGLTANGRPLDIEDRIGGSLRILGTPGFPVVLTSIADDTIGSGFDPEGRAQTDTNNDTTSTSPSAGDWRSIKIDEFSNDRNVAATTELEPAQSTGAGINGTPGEAQNLGLLATGENASDDNLRLGYTVAGVINNIDDVDVYSFQGTAGTQVWFDIDRTNISLDAVVELVDSDGNIIAQSDNSLDESTGALGIFSDSAAIETTHVNSMQNNPQAPRNAGSGFGALGNTFADFYSTNPLDPGLRLVLPGATGSTNTYFVRVRSSNIDSRDPGANRADLQDPSKLSDGKTEGQYRLQVRLQQLDEVAGSSINFADIRYATNGIEILGGPAHSPLMGEVVELTTDNNTLANALDLGNLLNTDQATLSVAGDLNSDRDIDWYRFDINQDSIQNDGLTQQLATVIDVDYADGLGRANTSLWLYYDDQNGIGGGTNTGIRLVNFGTDSNIADDIGAPLNGSDTDDLSRGTAGLLDAFIGSSALPAGTYYLAITSNELTSNYLAQFYAADAGGNPLTRVEPVNSVRRIIEDRFGGSITTAAAPLQVGFTGTDNQVPYTLADIPLLITQNAPGADTSELITVSAITGEQTSLVSRFPYVEDAAIRGDGTLHGARSPQNGVINDANSGGILDIDVAGDGATTAVTAGSGIVTNELDRSVAPPAAAVALTPGTGGQRQGRGMEFRGLSYPQVGNTQFLYGVASRGGFATTFDTFGGPVDARNYIYKLDPTSLAATSAPQANRQNAGVLAGAGTQIVERGYIDTSIDRIQNTTYQTIIMDAASPANAPSLLDGDTVTVRTGAGDVVLQWTAAQLSGTLIANTSPQSQVNNFPPAPTNIFDDGETFSLTVGATTRTFEIDTGRIIENNYVALTAPATIDGSTFTITDSLGSIMTFEFDATGGGVVAGNIAVVYDPANSTQFQVSQAIVAAINGATGVDPAWTARAALLPGTNRISLTGDTSVVLGSEDGTDTNVWTPTIRPNPLSISSLTAAGGLGAGQTYDGATFMITDLDGDAFTFEFDTNNAVSGTNVAITINDTDNAFTIAQFVQSAINFPTGVNPAPANWNVTADAPAGTTMRLLGDASIVISPNSATVVNPIFGTAEYGLVDAASGNDDVLIEEYFTNLDDTQLLPTPSTPGAMDELIAAINAAGMGITASAVGTRLVLAGADAADFSGISSITSNVSGGGGTTPMPFNFTDSAAVLNNTLFNTILAIEPNALRMADGRIWLPGSSSFVQAGTDDRDDFPARNAQLSAPQYGYVEGIAFSGNTMFAVSENGDLFRVGGTNFSPNSSFNNGDFIDTIYNTTTRQRVQFVGLTSGPRNAETNLGLSNLLFGIDSSGVVYAFDTQGRPANIFEDGAWFLQTDASSPSGLAFANLDVNLWHTTANNRNTDDGHGVNVSFDGSRRAQQQGGNSLYFGFEDPQDGTRQLGDWSGVNDPGGNFPGYDATIYDSYDFTGGAKGSVVSNTLDLSDYSPGDKPMLYFNYYLATEDSNANNPGNTDYMKDAMRVLVAGTDGDWQLLATNNSDYDAVRNVGQRDELDYPFEQDLLNALSRPVSEIFEATVNGAPDNWRQARVDLSRFAGEENVRIRFDFSTAGSFDVGGSGGVELVAVAGDKIRERQTFQISGTTFEFDLGLVLQIPSAGRITAGQTFEVDGVTYTFAADNTGDNVLVDPTDSGATIAARIVAKLQARGLNVTVDPSVPSRISVLDAVNTTPAVDPGLPINFVSDTPGVTAGNISVLINNAMDADQVRDAIRTSLAATFNLPGQENNLDVVRFNQQSIFLWNKTIDDAGPLGSSTSLQGDEYGEPVSGTTNNVGRGAQRGQNNRFEGVYIDDIIVGFAERGEMVTYQDNGTASDTTFIDNPRFEPSPDFVNTEVTTGTYQIEIRRGATYGIDSGAFPNLGLFASFDTNDRFVQQTSLIAASGADLADGQTFQLSDGIDTVTFEYNDTSILTGPNAGVAQGNIQVPFSSLDSPETVAIRLRDAINSPQAQASLNIVAGLSDGTATGTTNLGKTTGTRVVALHGTVASDNQGSGAFDGTQQFTVAGATQSGFVLHGVDTFKFSESGDSNHKRAQGQVIVHSNIVRDSSNYGILIDAGARTNNTLIPLAGALPHPGSVRNLVQFNQEDLVPGPVVINNLVYANAVGGILFSGDNRNANIPEAPTPFGRVLNNTVVGINGAGIGINVTDNASPTLLNNIVASFATGISIDGTSTTTVVGATTYQNNGVNSPTNLGTDAQTLAPTAPLFVDAAGRNYYLAEGASAIDASIDTLNDRQAMTTVRDPLGIAVSPILAPDSDITGQLRVDDPNVSNPNGTGGNPFKDRGAFDRSDFFGPVAEIQQPLDNDPDRIDDDRTITNIQLTEGTVDFFSILLFESEGTGPDATTVTSNAVTLVENGRLLQPGIDYIFGYSPASRLIRLTPLSGIWRTDSVYEITLNNQDGIRVAPTDGSTVADGDSFTVDTGSLQLRFEYDTDGSVTEYSIPVGFEAGYSQYQMALQIMSALNGVGINAYMQGDSTVMVPGAVAVTGIQSSLVGAITDIAGNPLQPNRTSSLTQFTIVMPDVELDYGDAKGPVTTMTDGSGQRSIDVPRHALLPIDVPLLALGSYSDGEIDGQPTASSTGDDQSSLTVASTIPGSTTSASGAATVLAQAATAAIDGQSFTITDGAANAVTFEFDTDAAPGTVSAGNLRVAVTATSTADEVATALSDAANAAVLAGLVTGILPVASGPQVSLGGSRDHSFDFASAPTLTRVDTGEYALELPAAGYADGQTVTVTDVDGRTLTFEIDDNPTNGPATVQAGNIAVSVDLTAATAQEIVDAIASSINQAVAGRRLSMGSVATKGLTLEFSADDEDGVQFGSLFNSSSRPVPVTVTSTRAGILDVWIDWNSDGDYTDAGERIASNLPVAAGENVLMVTTPATAAIGYTNSRFRLSTGGNLLSGGVGIGGEVEDHLIEIVGNTPPTANDDSYQVDEDSVLIVPSAGIVGLLDNDIDSEPITVNDEDPSTPGIIDPVKDVSNGTLVLSEDGSFTYTPSLDFFGVDTFEYNASDARLSSLVAATVTITVNPINDPPTAIDDEITIFEDESIVRDGNEFTFNDLKGQLGNPSQSNELGQTLEIIGAEILHPNPITFGGSVNVVNNEFTYTPPANYNDAVDGPVLVRLTIQDAGVAGGDANPLTDESTLTINLTAVNDAPIFNMPSVTAAFVEDPNADPLAPVVVPNFASDILPGPSSATDEGPTGEDQQVSFRVTALDPNLFDPAFLPTIDATGTLTYRLNPDVNQITPFPTILVEVTGVDTGAGGTVVKYVLDPSLGFPSSNTFDGATITVEDNSGNRLVLELENSELPGVGSTGGYPHAPVAIDTSDSAQTIAQKIVDAINNPPVGTIDPAVTFAASAYVDSVNGEIVFENVNTVSSTAAAPLAVIDNNSPGLVTGTESYDGATFTLTDTDGDVITFEFNDTTDAAPAIAGVTAGNAPIDYDPTFTQEQLSQAIADAINTPPAAITGALGGTWDISATLPAGTNRLQLRGVGDLATSPSTTEIINPVAGQVLTPLDPMLALRPNNESFTRTFTILPDPINDAPEFTIPTTINLPEDAGPIKVEDFITDARPGPVTALDEIAGQTLTTVVTPLDPSAFTATGQPSIILDQATGLGYLTFETASDVNGVSGHDLRVTVAISDDGGVRPGSGDVDTTEKTFTLSIAPINDAPSFNLSSTELTFFEDEEEVSGNTPTIVAGFATDILQGPTTATDETTLLPQNLTFGIVSVSDPSLFAVQPQISAAGDLSFETAQDQNGQAIIVVNLVDSGPNANPINGRILSNRFDPAQVAPGTLNTYDGATLSLTDTEGNVVVFEFEDVNLPGVGNSGAPHVAVSYDPATDTLATLNQALIDAINNPPVASIVSGGAGGWAVVAAIDPLTELVGLTNITSIASTAGAAATTLSNAFPALNAGETYDGATVTITDASGDVITFELNDTSDTPPAVTGVTAGNVAVDYDPTFTQNQLSQAISDAINNPPQTILDTLVGTWEAQSNLAAGSDQLQLTGVASVSVGAESAPVINPLTSDVFAALDPLAIVPTDQNQSLTEQTFTINLTAVNDAPEFTIPSVANAQEDQGLVNIPGFAAGLRPGPAAATDEGVQQFTVSVQATDPSAFTVQPAIGADGTLSFETAPDVNSSNANLEVTVFLTDDGTAGPLPDNNTSATQTFTIDVAEINDEPRFTLTQSEVTVIEDVEQFTSSTETIVPGFATNLLPGPATATDEANQTLTFEILTVSAPELFSVQPTISPTTGDLTFTTAQHKNGKSVVIARLLDDGADSPAPNDNISSLHTFTISISPINDAPQFDLPNVANVDEDAGLVSHSQFATNVRRGPVGSDDENSQLIGFEVAAVDPSAFVIQPAIGVDGTLTFQTAEHVNSANADLRVITKLVDNGAGSPLPNQNESAEQTFTIIVNPVNDAPTSDAFGIGGTEDSTVVIQSADVLVGDIAGPTIDELGQMLRITQIGRTSTRGGSIAPVFGDPGDPTKITSMTYVPPANLAGEDTFQYVVTDNGTPERSGTGTITVVINGTNDAPQFSRGADQFAPEDAGEVTVPNWATNILAGPPSALDEHASQTVSFDTVASTPGLFSVQPFIDSSGTLTYTSAPNANGASLVTVRALDDGPANTPNVNASPVQTFTITINPVNDAPVFTAGSDVTVTEDSGAFTTNWASDIAPALGLLSSPQTAQDEATQGVDFNLSIDRPELFSVAPAISSSGVLTFTPQSNAFGEAVVEVTLVDRGPANPADENTSTTHTLTITIDATNDAPVAVPDSYSTTEDGILNIAANGVLANDTDVDMPLDSLSVVAGTIVSDSGADVTLNADGSLVYDATSVASFQQLQTGQSIFDRFVYQIQDASGTTSQNATVTIRVDGQNDAPVAADDAFSVGVGQSLDLTVLTNDSDVDSTIDPRTIQVTASPAFGSAVVNAVGVVRYTPDSGFRGVDTFRYTVLDSSGLVSNEAIVTVTVNSAPVAGNDNAITFKNEPIDINVAGNDSDLDGSIDLSSVNIEQLPNNGTVDVLGNGIVRFTPTTSFAGNVSFSYTIKDNVGTPSNVATVSVNVLNSKWQNPQIALDVNADGTISPIDALILVNYINAGNEGFLPNTGIVPAPYLDPTGDEFITPIDVLQVINFLNSGSAGGGGEGEASESTPQDLSSTAYVMTVTPEQIIETVGPQVVKEIQEALDDVRSQAFADSEAPGVESPLPSVLATNTDDADDEDDVIKLLSCAREQVHSTPAEEVVDSFFSGIGPVRPPKN